MSLITVMPSDEGVFSVFEMLLSTRQGNSFPTKPATCYGKRNKGQLEMDLNASDLTCWSGTAEGGDRSQWEIYVYDSCQLVLRGAVKHALL